jgi:8-oxo-dGTP pyrophosphatase MutT (NUDIX family)
MAARRELTEEVGLVCDDFECIGWIAPLPGLISERVHMLVAHFPPEEAKCAQVCRGHEGIQRLRMIEVSELPRLCGDGRISSAVDAYFALRLAYHDDKCLVPASNELDR